MVALREILGSERRTLAEDGPSEQPDTGFDTALGSQFVIFEGSSCPIRRKGSKMRKSLLYEEDGMRGRPM